MSEEYSNGAKKLWDKYGIPTAIAVVVNLVMNKAPSYLRSMGELREKRRLELEEAREKRMLEYVDKIVRDSFDHRTAVSNPANYEGESK